MTSGLSSELLYLLCMREVPRYLQTRLCQSAPSGPQRRSQHSRDQPPVRLPPKPQFKFVQDNQASSVVNKSVLNDYLNMVPHLHMYLHRHVCVKSLKHFLSFRGYFRSLGHFWYLLNAAISIQIVADKS